MQQGWQVIPEADDRADIFFSLSPHIRREPTMLYTSMPVEAGYPPSAGLDLACTPFFGFLRSGVPSEAAFDPTCQLTPADIQVDNWESTSQLKQSKDSPVSNGCNEFCRENRLLLCPVAAYLALRLAEQGPLFNFSNGHALT